MPPALPHRESMPAPRMVRRSVVEGGAHNKRFSVPDSRRSMDGGYKLKRAGAGKAEASNALEVRRTGESAGAAAYRLLSNSHVNARSRLELDQLAKELQCLSYFSEPGRRAMLTGDLMQLMEAQHVDAGAVIMRQGEQGSSFFVLLEGECSVHARKDPSPGEGGRRSSMDRGSPNMSAFRRRLGSRPSTPGTLRNVVDAAARQQSGLIPEGERLEALHGPQVGRVHSGEAFGEKSALMGTDHTHTVLATGACSLRARPARPRSTASAISTCRRAGRIRSRHAH